MKWVIPSECQIGAHTFAIRFSPVILDAAGARGQSEYLEKQIIRLKPGRSSSQTCQSFLHEVMHSIDMVLGADENVNEATIRFLSAGLTQVLLSLGIKPDFSQIPEEEL